MSSSVPAGGVKGEIVLDPLSPDDRERAGAKYAESLKAIRDRPYSDGTTPVQKARAALGGEA